PILVGTGGSRMLRITARHADEWNTWGNLDMARERRTAFEAACDAVGRDPSSMRTSVQAMLFLTDSDEAIAKARSGPFAERTVAGPVNEVVDSVGRYAEMGFDEFILPDWNLGATPEQR